MAIEQFPGEENKREGKRQFENTGESDKRTIHHPEFIVIEEDYQQEDVFPQFESFVKQQIRWPFRVRIMTFAAGVFMIIWTLWCLALFTATLLCATLVFYQSASLNGAAKLTWKRFTQAIVIGLGLFIGTFSPYLGLTLIIAYLATQDPLLQQGFFLGVLKQKLREFTK